MALGLLIKDAEVYSPAPMGRADILCLHGKISVIGKVEEKHLQSLNIEVEVIEARGAIVIPGLIDPHEHLIGGSGEDGFAARTPEISLSEIVLGGITTVVGCLGTDTYTRNMPALLGHAKALNEEGITAFIYAGGYPIPPATLSGSIKTDMILVPEVLGAGEIAIADSRSSQSSTREVAKVVSDAYVGGTMTGKCGVTHFHMGEGKARLQQLRELLEDYDIKPECLYPTHVNREDKLLREAALLSTQGMTVDIDVYDEDLHESVPRFVEYGGDLNHVTLSTDASSPSPGTLFRQMMKLMQVTGWPLEKVLPLATTNTASVLKLPHKGKIEVGADADLVVLDTASMLIRDVIAKGKIFVRSATYIHESKSLKNSNRKIEIYGKKTTR